MTELEQLLAKALNWRKHGITNCFPLCAVVARRAADVLPVVVRSTSCLMRGVIGGAAIGGDAIAEVCIRKPSASVKPIVPKRKRG